MAGTAAGCRREASAPIARGGLFPDAGPAPGAGAPQPEAAVQRLELARETEPNDQAHEAQPLGANALVDGTLTAAAPQPSPPPAPKSGRKGKGKGKPPLETLDSDWFRLPAPAAGHATWVELRSGPACAELELHDDTGRSRLRSARWWRGVRPALPALGSGARASLVRLVCRARAGETAGGAYRLAVWTRPLRPDEEQEPNDTPGPTARVLAPGETLQATLAPEGDVDAFSLDLGRAQPGEALALSVAGIPELELEVRLLDPVTLQPILERRPGKGAAVLVPNLDVRRTGDHPLVTVRALAGSQPDVAYALSIQPLLPPGCTRQAECAELLPTEREPNDTAELAFALEGTTLTASGLVDSPGDVDGYRLPARTGGVALVRLQGPAALQLALQVALQAGAEADGLELVAAGPGGMVEIGGLSLERDLVLAVRAEKGGHARNEAYRLSIEVLDLPDFELERAERGDPWAPQQRLYRVEAPLLPAGGWQRHGALLPAADRDGFGVDLGERPGPTGLELTCRGDGAPGLQCSVLDAAGHELVRVTAPPDDVARTPLVVAPGRYQVRVSAGQARPSQRPYRVQLAEMPEAVGLPLGATAAAPLPGPATPTQAPAQAP